MSDDFQDAKGALSKRGRRGESTSDSLAGDVAAYDSGSTTEICLTSASHIADDYFGSSGIVVGSSRNSWTASATGSIGLLSKSATEVCLTSASYLASDYLGSSGVIVSGSPNPWVASATGIQIRQQRFEVTLPLQFNNGKDVPVEMLEEAKLELLDLFGGVSYFQGGGLWKQSGTVFCDAWIRVMIEVPDLDSNERLMKQFKERWRLRLDQIDLRLTSQEVKVL